VFQLESAGCAGSPKTEADEYERYRRYGGVVPARTHGPYPQFLEGKKNPKNIKYLHKDLVPVSVKRTAFSCTRAGHGYRAQPAGYKMSEADNLRMAMGKKKKSLMDMERVKFIEGCIRTVIRASLRKASSTSW
jgi:DNA polymerase-3 subunit alpha